MVAVAGVRAACKEQYFLKLARVSGIGAAMYERLASVGAEMRDQFVSYDRREIHNEQHNRKYEPCVMLCGWSGFICVSKVSSDSFSKCHFLAVYVVTNSCGSSMPTHEPTTI